MRIVEPHCGPLEGAETGGVSAFLGIPYAEPPIDELRWRPPQPRKRWSTVRDATRAAPRCIQHAPYGELEPANPRMSEDCLYLNIWTPAASDGAALPVLFWIHGGEFFAGSGTEPRYDGAHLAARGVVVVTINHRLGVFGFLSHPELSAQSSTGTSGNYGLLDQIAALNWVRENIVAFGGNPDCITVAGESAGSCSVSALMASPLAQQLFHRALGQSCAYFMPEPHAMKPLPHGENEELGIEFLRAAGAHSIAELRTIPGAQLLKTWLKDPSKRMQPCIDGHILPDVAEVFARRQQARVPLLTGWNGDEYGFLRGMKFDAGIFRSRLADSFGADAEAILDTYGRENLLETSVQLASDRAMVWPTWRWAQRQKDVAPVFVYEFGRAPPGTPFGAMHASEIEYVFGTLDSKPRNYEDQDRDLSDRMGDYWVTFARTGNPNSGALPHWPDYRQGREMLGLSSVIEGGPVKHRARLELLEMAFAKKEGRP